ncbi:RPII140-upstream gene protein isoform X2 [Halyomorpha halys]|uniref:RPII140-upstream gene protein isoform X2 n=1 Tax=Halyomorpha halys TaxID=286706 RepID=UPI0006D4F9BA|nr:RPII140-upstream gene protein isoform X2 [Halyomorpha halys]
MTNLAYLPGTGLSRHSHLNNLFFSEFGQYSPQLTHVYQTTIFAAFAGGVYGGCIYSRKAYLDFIERNEATKFKDHFEAKKELQNYVTVNFAKGAFKWGWRVCLFTGLYMSFVTALHVYRDESSILNYIIGGLVSGMIYRINYGLRGLVVGGTLGSMVGLAGGCLTLNILRVTGHTYDDIYQIQEEQLRNRNRLIKEAEKTLDHADDRKILEDHDRIVKDVQ